MKEKIQQLAGQVCDSLHDGDWDIPDEFINKFALLIAAECAKICDSHDSVDAVLIGNLIRRKFGIVNER